MPLEADTRIVEAYKPNSIVEARCISQMLEDAGIECEITGEDLASMYGVSMGWNKTSILVAEDNVLRARELIADQLAETPKEEPSKRGFQYGMRALLINFTLLSIILGFYIPLGDGWPDFAMAAFYCLLLGNCMVLAYLSMKRLNRKS